MLSFNCAWFLFIVTGIGGRECQRASAPQSRPIYYIGLN